MPLADGVFAATYVAVPASATAARKAVRDVLIAWRAESLIDDVMLVTCEVMANAIDETRRRAPATPISVRFLWNEGSPLLEVSDPVDARPVMRSAADTDVSGRGLQIVSAVAKDWGCYPTLGGGKTVWARFVFERGAVGS